MTWSTNFDRLDERIAGIQRLEKRGDQIDREINQRLENAFVAPFDREDIHELTVRLDDVVDYIQAVGESLMIYDVKAPTDDCRRLAHILADQGTELAAALTKLNKMKDLDDHLEVHELEHQADGISRAAIGTALPREPTTRSRSSSGASSTCSCENAIDAAEDAAEAIERMIHKRAERRAETGASNRRSIGAKPGRLDRRMQSPDSPSGRTRSTRGSRRRDVASDRVCWPSTSARPRQAEPRDPACRGAPARRGGGPRPALRPARPRQDDAGQHHRPRAGRQHAHHVRPGHRAAGRPGRDPDQPRGARRPVHRRDPPPQPLGRGDPLPGDGGLRDRRDDRPRAQSRAACASSSSRSPWSAPRPAPGASAAPLRDRFGAVYRLDYYPRTSWPTIVSAPPAS